MRMHKKFTLVLIREGERVLLGLKKRGFGKGKWNGFGGKIEKGETISEAAHRELEEEALITCENMEQVAVLHFEFEDNPVLMEVHVFHSRTYHGTPTETEEMKPKWFSEDDVPYKDMWLDDQYWWPYFLRGDTFHGYFKYRGYDSIISHKITLTSQFEDFTK